MPFFNLNILSDEPQVSFIINFFLLISNFGFAQSTYTFTNVSGNAWSTAANWSPSYPGTSITVDDQVYINGACELDVTIS
ncbi:MAG: hypothetical protein ACI956_000483, partial [Nonlabens sp.]